MPEIADFIVIKKGAFPVGDSPITFVFALPLDTALNSNAILGFVVQSIQLGPTATSQEFSIKLNTHPLMTLNVAKGTHSSFLKAFGSGGGNLLPGPNIMILTGSVTFGSVTLSDLVLWFQRNI
jgi:hypothetical protein